MLKRLRRVLKNTIGYIIERIEKEEMRKYNISYYTPKIIEEFRSAHKNISVLTPNGYKPILKVVRTKPLDLVELRFSDGSYLECADLHDVYVVKERNIIRTHAKEVRVGDVLVSDKQKSVVVKDVLLHKRKFSMFDIEVDSEDHTYYTNGVLSHNTTTIAAVMTWLLCFSFDYNISAMANKQATSTEIISKVTNMFAELPFFLKPGIVNKGSTYIVLDNRSRLTGSATTATAKIGFTVNFLYLDEFAHVPANIGYSFWRSVIPTLSSLKTSRCVITSTPNGVQNKFFEVWDGANKATNSYLPIRVDWWRVPGRDQAWAEQMKKDFGEAEFAQEFELKFNTASSTVLKQSDFKLMEKIYKEYKVVDFSGIDKDINDNILWHPDFDPLSITPEDKFILSIDLAEGKQVSVQNKVDNDFNVINIFKIVPMSNATILRYHKNTTDLRDCFRLVQVGLFVDRSVDEEVTAEVAKFITFDLFCCGLGKIDNVRILVEMNFNGKNFLTHISTHYNYYPNIVFHTHHTKPIQGEYTPMKPGYKTTPTNREYYIKKGALRVGKRNIIITQRAPRTPNKCSYAQLTGFGATGKKGKLQGIGVHDDISMTIFNLSRIYELDEFTTFLDDMLQEMPEEKMRMDYIINTGESYKEEKNNMLDSTIRMIHELNEKDTHRTRQRATFPEYYS